MLTRKDIVAGLRRLGVKPGMTVLVHSSYRSLGGVRGGPEAVIDALLEAMPELLAPGGRAAVLSYHSLEARRVKGVWRRQAAEGLIELLTRRALKPSEQEVADNPRARSAQLRAMRRL